MVAGAMLVLLGVLGALVVWWAWRCRGALRRWQELGVCYVEPAPIVGNWWPVITQKIGQGEFYTRVSRQSNSTLLGNRELGRELSNQGELGGGR